MKYLIIVFLMTAMISPVSIATTSESREWSFRVLLDDKPVGTQQFRLHNDAGKVRLETEADLAVKMLFVTVYRYRHQNVETWDNGCLTGIESRTKVNGKQLSVAGAQKGGSFVIDSASESQRLPECVMSFAYWNPSFLKEPKLLNSQNGDYVDVDVSGPVADQRTVRGEVLPAQRYRLIAGEIDMEIWYSLDNQWLALESKTSGGRILTYDLL